MRRRLALLVALPVALTLAAGGLTGCSDESPEATGSSSSSSASSSPADTPTATPTESPTDSPAASPTGSKTPTARPTAHRSTKDTYLPRSQVAATNLHKAVLGTSAARTAEEKAAVDAWVSYWQGAADSYYYYQPTQMFLQVSAGSARKDIVDYLNRLKRDKQRVAGWAVDNVTSVRVTGGAATIRDCTRNYTFTVDQEGDPLTRPVPFYDVTGKLRKSGGQWTVVSQDSKELKKSCLT
jgi:hypothetical protein